MPHATVPRIGSPCSGCSTLTTSAPHSARMAPAAGTKAYKATSRTRMPSMALGAVRLDGATSSPGDDSGERPIMAGRLLLPGAGGGGGRGGGDRDCGLGERPLLDPADLHHLV